MEITKKANIDIKKTVENSVAGSEEFHFFVDELSADNTMPTYLGKADEKYNFDEMDDSFFEFLKRKSQGDGIYIRLVYASGIIKKDSSLIFKLEYGNQSEEFTCQNIEEIFFEFADYGINVRGDEVTFGASADVLINKPCFEEFNAGGEFSSLDNPLNKRIFEIMQGMLK